MSAPLPKLKSLFAKSTAKEHPLFLRWSFLNTVSLAFFGLLTATGFFHGVHGPPAIAAALALVLTAAVSIYLGKLYWRADVVKKSQKLGGNLGLDDFRVSALVHASERAFYCVAVLQTVGMLGAMFGYRMITSATDIPDAQQAVHAATAGLGNGLTATIIGVLGSIIIGLLHFELEHELTKP